MELLLETEEKWCELTMAVLLEIMSLVIINMGLVLILLQLVWG
jgi:hypothetical protein